MIPPTSQNVSANQQNLYGSSEQPKSKMNAVDVMEDLNPLRSSQSTPINMNTYKMVGLLRLVGYALTAFACIDLLYAVIPPKFTDPIWEFQTIGDWFERIPVLMLGLILVFYGERDFRKKLERYLLSILSWATLPLSICLLLLIPLCINDSIQINRLNNNEISLQVNEQSIQMEQNRDRILNASDRELESLLLTEEEASQVPDAPRTVQAAKEIALSNLKNAEERAQSKAEQARQNLKRNLFKNTVRLLLGCFISAMTIFLFWENTAWARSFSSYRTAQILPSQAKSKGNWKQRFSRQPKKSVTKSHFPKASIQDLEN